MGRNGFLFLLPCLPLIGCSGDTAPPKDTDPVAPPPVQQPEPEAPAPEPPKQPNPGRHVSGWVTAVSRTSVTLSTPAADNSRGLCLSNGKYVGWVINEDVSPAEAGKRFRVNSRLEAGEWQAGGSIFPHTAYRLSDVRVGDLIWISARDVDGVNVCDSISIRRRPGGVLPPSPGDPEGKHKYHEVVNAAEARNANGGQNNPSQTVPMRLSICKGLEIESENYVFDAEGPWYVRVIIPPRGCFWAPVETWRPATRPTPNSVEKP